MVENTPINVHKRGVTEDIQDKLTPDVYASIISGQETSGL